MSENALQGLMRGSLLFEEVQKALESIDPRTVGTAYWQAYVAEVHAAAAAAAKDRDQFNAAIREAFSVALKSAAEFHDHY